MTSDRNDPVFFGVYEDGLRIYRGHEILKTFNGQELALLLQRGGEALRNELLEKGSKNGT